MRRSAIAALIAAAAMLTACDEVVDDRIPAMPVTILLSNAGSWNTYGVAAYGQYRYFIKELRQPANFGYTDQTFTGFGGVLLIGGVDPFNGNTLAPLAYDLSCPVECKPDIRVAIDPQTLDAVCPVCGSHYNVTSAVGAPVSGVAADGKHKYGLQRYSCRRTSFGGYDILR